MPASLTRLNIYNIFHNVLEADIKKYIDHKFYSSSLRVLAPIVKIISLHVFQKSIRNSDRFDPYNAISGTKLMLDIRIKIPNKYKVVISVKLYIYTIKIV